MSHKSELFYSAASKKQYACFLTENTELPMMHIDDLIDGTVHTIFFGLINLDQVD
jgi:hypothetical protein